MFYWKEDKSKLNLELVAVCSQVSSSKIILTSDARYLFVIEYWDGMSIIDFASIQLVYSSSNHAMPFSFVDVTPVLSHWWPTKSNPNGHAIALSID